MLNKLLYNLPLQTKLFIGFFVTVSLSVVVALYFYTTIASLNNSFTELDKEFREVQLQLQISATLQEIRFTLRDFVETSNPLLLSTFDMQHQKLSTLKETLLSLPDTMNENETLFYQTDFGQLQRTQHAMRTAMEISDVAEIMRIFDAEYTPLYKIALQYYTNVALAEEEHYQGVFAQRTAATNNLQKTIGGIVMLLVVLSFIISYVLASYLTAPLRGLLDMVAKVKAGDFSVRTKISSSDEIGMLGMAFNDMLTHIQHVYFQMEESVQEKTKELESRMESTEKQNRTLQDTKRAMMNLLEDARESEDKIATQTDELKKALSETARFASIADQERNMYLLLISSIGEGVIVMDPSHTITIMNRAAEQITGYAAPDVVGKSFESFVKFIYQDKREVEKEFWDKAFASMSPIALPADMSILNKESHPIPVAEVISPILDKKTNEQKGIIMTFRDVREERALEEARIGFISVASHQLRTPLTSMRWFSEMLLGGDAGKITEEQQHFVERIYQGTDRMIALVNLLLQIARVEAGRVKIEPTPVDLKTTTTGVQLTLKALLDQKEQQVTITSDPDPFPLIPMDQEVIWQVVQNILSNAIRYSQPKGVITVRLKKVGDTAEYSITDTGIGIPKQAQPRIFEKFFRAENALKSVPEGSGLGMSLVKLLVEGWGGKIWFESEEGKGTTFYFTIPLSGMRAREGEVKLAV